MKRHILVIMIVMLVVMVGVVPQAVYGADGDESLLTPEERAFKKQLLRQTSEVRAFCTHYGVVAHRDYRTPQDIVHWTGYLPIEPPNDCGIQSSPAVFEAVRAKWNNEVCPAFRAMRSKMLSCCGEAMEDPDAAISNRFQDSMRALIPEIDYVDTEAEYCYHWCRDIANDLIETRKEVREKAKEKAKELLKNGDNEGEKDKNGENRTDTDEDKKNGDDLEDIFDTDCFIATAAYGSPTAREINILRQFRDEFLVHNYSGRAFVDFYYTTSPPVAEFISEHEILRLAVREGFVDPIVAVVEFTESWWAE